MEWEVNLLRHHEQSANWLDDNLITDILIVLLLRFLDAPEGKLRGDGDEQSKGNGWLVGCGCWHSLYIPYLNYCTKLNGYLSRSAYNTARR